MNGSKEIGFWGRALLTAACLIGAVCLIGWCFSDRLPQDNATRQSDLATSFVETMNTRDGDKLTAFIKANFSVKARKADAIPPFVANLLAIARGNSPYKVGDVLVNKPGKVIVALTNQTGLDQEIQLEFDSDSPYGIISVMLGPLGRYSSPPAKSYTNWKSLHELADQVIADNKLPAMSVGVIHDGVTESEVTGVRRLEATDPAMIGDNWLIGSIGKSMTAMMIARLVDQGALRWDTTIADALPDVAISPEYKSVTILELLRHRGGIQQDLLVKEDFVDRAAGAQPGQTQIRDHYARFTLVRPQVAKPDEMTVYSNAGYGLVGHIAEVAMHKPYEQLMKELVFDPLGMTSARFAVPGSEGGPGAQGQLMGYAPDGDKLEPHLLDDLKLTTMLAPAGLGLSMDIEDLLKFARYQLDGLRGQAKLMSQANFDQMHQPPVQNSKTEQFACGWVVKGEGRDQCVWHTGSDGTFYGEICLWPQRNLAIVAIENAGSKKEPAPAHQAILAIYQRYAK